MSRRISANTSPALSALSQAMLHGLSTISAAFNKYAGHVNDDISADENCMLEGNSSRVCGNFSFNPVLDAHDNAIKSSVSKVRL